MTTSYKLTFSQKQFYHIVAIAHWFSIYTGGALRKLSSVLEEITHE